MDHIIHIEGSFEVPTDEEWDKYVALDSFESMRIDESLFESFKDCPLFYPRLAEIIHGQNNKVGNTEISYVLCRHYFDKGIPDDRWYISPGKDGQSIQYDPDFDEEHFMRRYWFNHFSASVYFSLFSVLDSVVELLNMFYDMGFKTDFSQKQKVLKWLKTNKRDIYTFLQETLCLPIYTEANSYRNAFAHGIPPSEVSELYPYKKNVTISIPDTEQIKKTGKYVEKTINNAIVMSHSVGKYTPVRTIIQNMEQFAAFSGTKIHELISLMLR